MRKLIVLLFISFGFSQLNSPKNGVGLNVGDAGAGIFYHRHLKSFENIKLGAIVRWTDIRPAREIPFYDYYTGTYQNTNTVSLAMFPLFGTFNFYPFEGKIANNFSPYLALKAGPIVILDADEEIDSFTNRWTKAKGSITYGSNIGVGIEFRQPGKINYSIEFTYDFVPLSSTTDGYNNLNGTVLTFSIHR